LSRATGTNTEPFVDFLGSKLCRIIQFEPWHNFWSDLEWESAGTLVGTFFIDNYNPALELLCFRSFSRWWCGISGSTSGPHCRWIPGLPTPFAQPSACTPLFINPPALKLCCWARETNGGLEDICPDNGFVRCGGGLRGEWISKRCHFRVTW